MQNNSWKKRIWQGDVYKRQVIDDLIHDITQEYNMTTIINTHDMNSVLGIGEKVIYIYEGHKEWEGTKDDIFTSTNELSLIHIYIIFNSNNPHNTY